MICEKNQEEILQGPPIEGLTKKMFHRPKQLHITLNLMTILDDRDLDRARQLLNDCLEDTIG